MQPKALKRKRETSPLAKIHSQKAISVVKSNPQKSCGRIEVEMELNRENGTDIGSMGINQKNSSGVRSVTT